MTPGLLKTNKGGRVRARPRPPDDPSIRVVLAEGFRRELGRERRARVASKVLSPGRSVLHPSSVSRYLRGRVSPTLLVARRLAAAAGRPLAEAVVAYSGRYGRPTQRWAMEMFFARPFRSRVFAFLEMFNNVLGYVHFGFPTDRERSWRRVVRPQHDRAEYAYFEIAIDEPLDQAAPFDFILAYQLFEHPAVFIDYGRISLASEHVDFPGRRASTSSARAVDDQVSKDLSAHPRVLAWREDSGALTDLTLSRAFSLRGRGEGEGASRQAGNAHAVAETPSPQPSPTRKRCVGEGEISELTVGLPATARAELVEGCVSRSSADATVEVSGFEIWTRRSHSERVSPGASRIWVQTWIDGKATDFVVRSSRPFTVGPMVAAEELPAGPLVIIPFHPGGMHRHAPAGV
jgi:hypothetical protein